MFHLFISRFDRWYHIGSYSNEVTAYMSGVVQSWFLAPCEGLTLVADDGMIISEYDAFGEI